MSLKKPLGQTRSDCYIW